MTLLRYLSNFLFDRLGKQRMTPIIRPGKSEFLAEVMGGGFLAMFQALSSAGPSIMATPLLVQSLWQGFSVMPWWSRRCPQIVVENVPRSHVSCMKYPCTPIRIIISIVFSSFPPPFKP